MSKHIKRIIMTIAVASTLCFVGCSELEAAKETDAWSELPRPYEPKEGV